MKLFKTTSGFVFSFGFNMSNRKLDPHIVCWNDPETADWNISDSSLAGFQQFDFEVVPEFVFEVEGRVVAYQPGLCLEFYPTGDQLVWAVRTLRP